MKFEIKIKKGLDSICFGCKSEEVLKLFGEPESMEEIDSMFDGSLETWVWGYPDHGFNFFFDLKSGNELELSTIESDNAETLLFSQKPFSLDKAGIISLMKSNGYNEMEEDEETWGEHRVSFEDAQLDFFFIENELVSICWSNHHSDKVV
jgi:hypothetical protein